MKVLGVPVPAPAAAGGRALKVAPRPRLADGHARRREGAPLARPALPRRARSSRCCTSRARVAPELEARDIRTTFVQHLPGVATPLPPLPAALPRRRRVHRPRRLRPRRLQLALRGQGRARGAGRASTSATATRRCATCGTATTTTSGRAACPRLARAVDRPRSRKACAPGTWPPPARVHHFAANSAYVAGRIRRYYGRDADGDPAARRHRLLHARTPDAPGRTTSWSPRSCPTSGSSWCLDAYRGTGRGR